MSKLQLTLTRKYRLSDYTIGHLYVDGKYFCDTLEDVDRELSDTMTEAEIKAKKLKSITAIPTGVYYVNMTTKSAKFGDKPFYRQTCGGKLPRLLGVKGFDGILIHCGNTANDTDGCILVGENKMKGRLINSRETFQRLYAVLKDAANRRVTITITIM